MKKLILILCFALFQFVGFSQISFDGVGTKNYFTKYVGQTKIGNSSAKEVNDSIVVATKALTVVTSDPYANSVFSVKGLSTLQSVGTSSATSALRINDNSGTQLFKVRSDGALFTGTVQATQTSTFVAGSNTITVTNGLITNIQ